MKNIELIKEEILNFDKNDVFYKDNSFEEACYKLTCAFENDFLETTTIAILTGTPNNVSPHQDNFRHAYRESLKHAYRYCVFNNEKKAFVCDNPEPIKELMGKYFYFNDIRNMFEQSALGKYTVNIISENEIEFVRNKAERSFNAELYARWVDSMKPELESRELDREEVIELYQYIFDYKYLSEQDITKDIFCREPHFKKLYQVALKKVENDSEEISDYDFDSFTTKDFQKIYAVIIALAVSYMNYHFVARVLNKIELHKNEPIIKMTGQQLIPIIKKYSCCDEVKINDVLKLLVYDPELHKDKYTIFQPLFYFENIYFFSPSLVYFSMAYDKLLFLMKNDQKHNQLISRLAKEREHIMTNEICDYIEKNTDWLYSSNFLIKENNKSVSEFDIIVYDETIKKLLLIELKWFFKHDGEGGQCKIDGKIKNSINNRIKKERFAKQYLDKIMEELDVDSYNRDEIEILSCIISKNFSGSDFVDDKIAIFDEFMFKEFIKSVEFKMNAVFEKIKDKSYIPNMDSYGIKYFPKSAEYAGYTVHFKQMHVDVKGNYLSYKY